MESPTSSLITSLRERFSQALRRLRHDWGFTAAFMVTLALGIAANAAVFSALDAYFLHPLPYPRDRALVNIYFDAAKYPIPAGSWMSAPGYHLLQSARALSASGLAQDYGTLTVAIHGEAPVNGSVAAVTASALKTLDVRPLLGRWISPAADRAGGPPEVDVGYRLWQSAFHGEKSVVGRTLQVSGKLYTIVGVMPPGFAFPARHTQLWVPIALSARAFSPQNMTNFNYVMIARMKPGSTRAQLDTELAGGLRRVEHFMAPVDRRIFRHFGAYIAFMPLRQWLGGPTRGRLLMMQLGAGVLLLLAAASLLNLALARALRRRDEVALRVVLGAARRSLLAQALLEALPLAAGATVIAWPLANLGMSAFTRFGIASASTSFDLHAGATLWVLAFSLAFLLTGTALALPQAFIRVDRPAALLAGAGKGASTTRRMRPLRLALSVGQIGLAIALLAGAVLLGTSLRNMLASDPGFASKNLYTAALYLQGPQYKRWGPWLAAHRRLAAAVAALPGVRGSGVGEAVPFSDQGAASGFRPAQQRAGGLRAPMGAVTLAGPGLMKTLGVHLLAGRLLDPTDAATNATSLVVDERFAQALFGTANVVGKPLKCSIGTGTCRIVGVVGTIEDRFASHYAFVSGTVFAPEDPNTFGVWGQSGDTDILIRSSEPPAVLAREVRNAVHRALPDQSLIAFAPMRELINDSAQGAAALASLLIAFGLLAFTLAIIGTYGVVAYLTGLRRREFAVRQTVGAQPAQIERLVLGQGLILWAFGTLLGVGCALVFARALASQLYRVRVFSLATYALPAIIVGAAVMLASWIPARGARKLDLIAQIRPE